MTDRPVYLKGRGRGRGKVNQANRSFHHGRPENTSWGRGQSKHQENGSAPSFDGNVPDQVQTHSAEERFKVVSSQFQDSIERHLVDNGHADNNSSDEEDIESTVLDKVFFTYSNNDDVDVTEAQSLLLHSFRSGTSACLVCIETIKKNDPIWCCEGCSAMFHIQCIQRWIREGVYQQVYKSEDNNMRTEDIPWQCPKCRLEYSQKLFPSRYMCFCGKVEEPKFDPWLVPHSCGQTCGKPLKPDCGHTCLLLCHPGSCPPCPKTLPVKCYCGNSSPVIRRCSARTWSCGKLCHRLLSCGQHQCQQPCHPGECPPCPRTSKQACQCGKSTALRPCASMEWQCDKSCGKRLSCGNHVCEQICHKGRCGSCPRGGRRQCPCGKTTYDLPCTEDIPTCGDTCDKLLDCKQHRCVQRCHRGNCGTCKQMIVKRCRCQMQKEKEVPCYKDFLCETKCSKLRNCQKHKCNRKCCDGNCATCEQTCNRQLRCKKHKCLSRCHRGPCYPCGETVDITCFCKATKITVPCGREKVTRPPKCNLPCKRPPDCHHPARLPHRCHFGECQPCRQVCNKPLEKCSHTCPVICHSAVKVRRQENKKRAGPWEQAPRIIETIENKPCPPCMMPLQVSCFGKHEVGTFACSVIQPYQCGRPCGRELACTNHTCELMCHIVERAEDDVKAGTNCQECELPCQFDRPEGCSHECPKPCHPGACPPCTQMIRMRCHCQGTVKYIECSKWLAAGEAKRNELKSCGGMCPKTIPCGHSCSFVCHQGNCSKPEFCEKKVTIYCKCRRQKKETKCRDKKATEASLVCNDICQQEMEQKKQKESEADRKKKEIEILKQKAELEEFERKMKGGRKKKQRKPVNEVVEISFMQRHKTLLGVSVGIIVLAVFIGYLLSMN